ncbi:hypothetical protein KSS87_006489 [Heliosperma pusillum]|nr:hypothetical protein KSS87_006489 [Heliosperma pusillum]
MSTSTTAALQGTGSGSGGSSNSGGLSGAAPLEDFHLSSSQLLSLHDSKHDAMLGSSFLSKNRQLSNKWNSGLP